MPKAHFNPAHQAFLDGMLLQIPEVTSGKMFGYPAYFVRGKLFACVYGEGVGIKIPQTTAGELLKNAHIVPFQPMGRAIMRQWVQINRSVPMDYSLDYDTFVLAIQFVKSIDQAC